MILTGLLLLLSIDNYTRVTNTGLYINNLWSIGEKYHSWTDIKSIDGDYAKTTKEPVYTIHAVFIDGTEWKYVGWRDQSATANVARFFISQHIAYQNQQYPAMNYP